MKYLSPPLAGLLPVGLALLAFNTMSLSAEDAYVTSGSGTTISLCPPSCPYDLGTAVHSLYISSACHVIRERSVFGITNTAAWKVTPTLANAHGTYRILVTKGSATDCSPDIMVNVSTTGGALADVNGTAQTTILTTAFQKANSVDSWTLVGYLTNNTTQPDVTFAYASGTASRFYMDAVDFQSVDSVTNSLLSARITEVLYGNPITLAGTGPVGHPFALVSSTNVAAALNQWTPEQTNLTGTGSFSFGVVPGAAKARFFRVITQ